jgi:DNA-binding NarL/FixJ family response regulator
MTITVLLVDDHAVVRQGLASLIAAAADLEVVGSVEDGARAAAAVRELHPDVVLMDLSMPVMDGIAATREVLAAAPDTRVLVLTSFNENARIHAALEAGATGYLLKDAEPADVLRGIRDAAAGGVPLSPQAARALLPGNRPNRPEPTTSLTEREREVLALVAAGLPNKSIARRLDISEKTVKAHLTKVFATLGVSDRTSAALWAQAQGWV